MLTTLTTLLLLTPTADAAEPPRGAVPTVKHVRWNDGRFEIAQTIPFEEEYTDTITIQVNGQAVLRMVKLKRTIFKEVKIIKTAAEVTVFDRDGKKLDEAEWRKALGSGRVALVSSDGELPHPSYRSALREGTLVIAFKPDPPK